MNLKIKMEEFGPEYFLKGGFLLALLWAVIKHFAYPLFNKQMEQNKMLLENAIGESKSLREEVVLVRENYAKTKSELDLMKRENELMVNQIKDLENILRMKDDHIDRLEKRMAEYEKKD